MLGVSPALLERYLAAARKIGALALGDPLAGPSTDVYRAPPDMSQSQHREGLPLGTQGGLVATHTFPSDGEYVIKVKLQETTLGQIRGLEYVNQVEVLLDGERIHLAEVGGPEDYVGSADNATDVLNNIGARLTVRVPVTAGPHAVATAFIGHSAVQGGQRLQYFRRTNVDTTDHTGFAHVENISIAGPFNATGAARTPSRDRILTCRPTTPAQEPACARQIVETLARRAYRRPVTASEVNRLLVFYEAGRKDGIVRDRHRARAAQHPREPEVRLPRGAGLDRRRPGTIYPISDLELASRLSFFLWSSIPDDELIEAARRGSAAAAGGARASGAADAGRPDDLTRWSRTSPDNGCSCATCERRSRSERISRFRRQPAAGVSPRDRAAVRKHGARRPQRARPAHGRLHVCQRAAGQALRHSPRLRQPFPARGA